MRGWAGTSRASLKSCSRFERHGLGFSPMSNDGSVAELGKGIVFEIASGCVLFV